MLVHPAPFRFLSALVPCLWLAASPAAAKTAPATPRAAIRRLAEAYEQRSVEELGALFSADYRFHFSSGDRAGAGYLSGADRDFELAAAGGMFHGQPRVRSIRVTVGGMEEGADPEHPDSLAHYRAVTVRKLAFDIRTSDEINQSLSADHVFYLVRGDVARRLGDQPGGTDRWYIRRWMEDIREVEDRLAGTDGRCDEADTTAAAGGVLPVGLALRVLDVPLCPTLDVACDLPVASPATLEVYDVQGRRLARQTLNPAAPGTIRVQAGSGRRFAPGAYWLRLTQAGQPPGKRLVVVAR